MKPLLRFIPLFAAVFFCANPLLAKSIPGGMNVVEINRYQLVGAEYWPFFGNEPFRYPSDVLWGFYPEGVSKDAVKCAEISHDKLIKFFRANWRSMRDVVELGATRKFYLWTNDYSSASTDRVLRHGRMVHWNTGPKDYSQGYWKWESTLRTDGTCDIPDAAQITQELTDTLRVLAP